MKQKLIETSKEFKEIEDSWYKEIDTLTSKSKYNAFVSKLISGYEHDFGTSLRALACIVNATIRFYGGGLSNFQASYLMWKILEKTFCIKDSVGLKIVRYEDLLYPQLVYHFDNELDKSQHEKLIELAKKNLVESTEAVKEVREHWEKIAKGWLPKNVSLKKDGEEA